MNHSPPDFRLAARKLRSLVSLQRVRGFSLVEVLVAIGFLGLLAALLLPAVGAFGGRAGELRRATATIAGLLEEARQYAVAHNTFVYVALTSSHGSTSEAPNVVTVFTARDGGHLFTTERNSLDLRQAADAERVEVLRRASDLKFVRLMADRGLLADQNIAPSLSGNSLHNGHRLIDVDGRELTGIFQFGPTGEASGVRGGTASAVEVVVVDLQRPNDGRVIQVSGITGLLHVFAP